MVVNILNFSKTTLKYEQDAIILIDNGNIMQGRSSWRNHYC